MDTKTFSLIQHALELVVQIRTPNCTLYTTLWVGPFENRVALDAWRETFRQCNKRDRMARRDFMIEIGAHDEAAETEWFDQAVVKHSKPHQINIAGMRQEELIVIEPVDPEQFARFLYSVIVERAQYELETYGVMAQGGDEDDE